MKSFSSRVLSKIGLALRQSIGDESPIILSANSVIQRAGIVDIHLGRIVIFGI